MDCRGGSRIPHRRGADPPWGAHTYDFVKFSKKMHEIEKMLGRGSGVHRDAPLDPPLDCNLSLKRTIATGNYTVFGPWIQKRGSLLKVRSVNSRST